MYAHQIVARRLNRAAVTVAALLIALGAPAAARAQVIVGRLVVSGDADPLGGNYGIVRNAGFASGSKAAIEATSIGIFRHDGSTLSTIARSGGPAAGGGTYANIGYPTTNANGDIVFTASVNSGPAPHALFLYDAGTTATSILAKAGDASPDGGTFAHFDQKPSLNLSRGVAFAARTTMGKGMFFRKPTGEIIAIVLDGDTGICGTGTFGGFSVDNKKGPVVNDNGDIAFWASETDNTEGMYLYTASGPALSAAACKNAATVTAGTYKNIGQQPGLNNNGEVVFEADVDFGPGPNHDSLFLYNGTCSPTACLIAETTGTGTGISGTFKQIAAAVVPVITDAGDVVFDAKLSAPNDDALLNWNETSGVFTRLVGQGDSCDSGGTIQGIQSEQASNGTSLAFRARCTNGNAILRKDGATSSTLLMQVTTSTGIGSGYLSEMPSIDSGTAVVFRGSRTSLQTSFLLPPAIIGTVLVPAASVPGVPGAFFESYSAGRALASANRVAFVAQTAGAVGVNEGVFLAHASANPRLQTVVMAGDASPIAGANFLSFSPGSLFEPLGGPRPAPMGRDSVAFVASLDDGTMGIFRGEAGALGIVARTGDPAPGGGTYQQLSAPGTDRNKIAYAAVTDTQSCVYYSNNDRQPPAAQACVGDVLPAPVGGTIASLLSVPQILGGRRVAFRATIANPSNECLLVARVRNGTQEINVVGCIGDAAPGGGTFQTFTDALGGGALAAQGNKVVSFASLGLGNGVYRFRRNGSATKIVAIGDSLLAPLSGVVNDDGTSGLLAVKGSYVMTDLSLTGGVAANAVALGFVF